MALLLACLPSNSKLDDFAVAFHCVEKMRKWRRFQYGVSDLLEIASILGCGNFRSLDDASLDDLVGLLAASFEDALACVRRRKGDGSLSEDPMRLNPYIDVKPLLDPDVKLPYATNLPSSNQNEVESSIGVFERRDDDVPDVTCFREKEIATSRSGLENLLDDVENNSEIVEFPRSSTTPKNGKRKKKLKKFSCDSCSKSFSVAKSLRRHEQRAHASKRNEVADRRREREIRVDQTVDQTARRPENDAVDKSTPEHDDAAGAEDRDEPEIPTTLESLVNSLNLPVDEYDDDVAAAEDVESRPFLVQADDSLLNPAADQPIGKDANGSGEGIEAERHGPDRLDDPDPASVDRRRCSERFVSPSQLDRSVASTREGALDAATSRDEPPDATSGAAPSSIASRDAATKSIFQCNLCGKQFKDKYYLRKHENIHTRLKTYVCDVCGKSFNQNSGLYTHKKLHVDQYPFKCAVVGCGKAFTTKNSLISHSSEHTGIRPFACEVCLKAFGNKRTLTRHRELHFVMSKSYNCSHCGKAFRRKADVDIHERIHTGIKPYICSFSCGRAFTQKQSLTEHERIHKGERPFGCDQCGKSFTQKSTLTKHRLTHKTGEPQDTAVSL